MYLGYKFLYVCLKKNSFLLIVLLLSIGILNYIFLSKLIYIQSNFNEHIFIHMSIIFILLLFFFTFNILYNFINGFFYLQKLKLLA